MFTNAHCMTLPYRGPLVIYANGFVMAAYGTRSALARSQGSAVPAFVPLPVHSYNRLCRSTPACGKPYALASIAWSKAGPSSDRTNQPIVNEAKDGGGAGTSGGTFSKVGGQKSIQQPRAVRRPVGEGQQGGNGAHKTGRKGGGKGAPWGKVLTDMLKKAITDTNKPEEALNLVEKAIENFNSLHCALVLSRVSHMPEDVWRGYWADPRWSTFLARLAELAPNGGPRDMAQTANSLARFKNRVRLPDGLMPAIQARAAEVWQEMNPQELALIVNGFANLPQPPSSDYWGGYETLVLGQVHEFGPQGLSMILNGFSKLNHSPSKDFLWVFESRLLDVLDVCNAQEFSNVLNAFGKLDHQPSDAFLARFEELTGPRLQLFKPQELAMTLNALGKMRYRPQDSYLQRCEALAMSLSDVHGGSKMLFKPQESAIMVNAFTKFADYDVTDEAYFTLTEQFGIAKVRMYRAQEMSNTIHGLGRLGHNPSTAFCDAFVEHSRHIMAAGRAGERFKTQELANLINGLAKFTYRPPRDFFLEVVDCCRELSLSRFSPQELANVLNGLMRLNFRADDAFLQQVVDDMRMRLHDFNAQELGMTLHALGRMLYYPGDDFMKAVVDAFVAPAVPPPLQSVTMMLNSFARLGWLPPDALLSLMDETVEEAIVSRTCKGPEIAQALNAMAHLNHVPSRGFLKCIKEYILEQKETLDLSTIAVLLWSFSVIRVSGVKGFMTEMVTVACKRLEGEGTPDGEGLRSAILPGSKAVMVTSPSFGSPSEWSNFGLPTLGDETLEPPSVMCMRQLMLTRRFLSTMKVKPAAALLARFDRLLQAEWLAVSHDRCEPNPSKLHQDVVGVLTTHLGLHCDIEVEDEGYVLDIVVHPPQPGLLPAVIEVDGPHHFFRNDPRVPMGFTRFKHDMLTACRKKQWGAVVSVSQLEWNENKDTGSRIALLRDKLSTSGLLAPVAR